ncbi:hypothetical protein QUF90_07640 [Desulfococcaceae bacterium HSG9]|nr:hypothetical protein [Desulfococcaceae bacterium HSG9]
MQTINQTAIVIKSKKEFSDAIVSLDDYLHADQKSKSYTKVVLLANSEIDTGLFDFISNTYQTICDHALHECTGGNYQKGSLKISYDIFRMWFHVVACETMCAEKIDPTPKKDQTHSPITGMLSNAEIYESMGLFVEAVDAYKEVMSIELEHQDKKSINEQIDRLKKIMTEMNQTQDLLSNIQSEPEPLESIEKNVKEIKNASVRMRFASLDKYSKMHSNGASGLIADQQAVKNLMNEADLYRVHDLRKEAWDKYNEALVLLSFNHTIKERERLSAYVKKMLAKIGDNPD